MQINFKNTHISRLLCFVTLFVVVGVVKTQDDGEEYREECLQYKKLLYEETKTISYFHPDAKEITVTEDYCKSSGGFVVGGENAQPKEFPSAARLGSWDYSTGDVTWLCGGTIISRYFILTAAHCFHSSRGDINIVRLGVLDFSSSTDYADPEDYSVDQLIEHPEFRYNEPYNDIGLVVLESAITFNTFTHPACLPTSDIVEENQNSLIAIGWGHTKFSGQESSHLQKVTLRPYVYADCAWLAEGPEGVERLPFGLQSSLLCAGSSQNKDTCQGDSGGPLLMQHPQYPCFHIVVGITSTGVGACGTPNVPALYTRVKNYLDWINYHKNYEYFQKYRS